MSNDEVTTQRRRFIICCDMTKGRLCHVPAFFEFVSHLICMFQDSVPAGSYNDPFLSSVCVCVCENRYHTQYNSTVQGARGSDSWRGPTKLQVSG